MSLSSTRDSQEPKGMSNPHVLIGPSNTILYIKKSGSWEKWLVPESRAPGGGGSV